MADVLKNVIVGLFLGLICTLLSERLHSAYLSTFLTSNLLMLLIAVLAISSTTVTVLIDKIGRIQLENPKISFEATRREIRTSLIEQIILIGIALIVLILSDSDCVKTNSLWRTFSTTILTAVLIYDIMVLWDSVNAVFVIDSYYRKK